MVRAHIAASIGLVNVHKVRRAKLAKVAERLAARLQALTEIRLKELWERLERVRHDRNHRLWVSADGSEPNAHGAGAHVRWVTCCISGHRSG